MDDEKRRLFVKKRRANPKSVRMTGKFCTFGRVRSNRGIPGYTHKGFIFIIPIGENQNNNWKV